MKKLNKEKIKSWWDGKTHWNGDKVTYATSDEPSPKEAFKVIVFFCLPWIIFLLLIGKYFFNK